MKDFREFNCSACGQVNLVESSELPFEGTTRTCQGCGVGVFIRPQDTAEAGSYSEDATAPPVPSEGFAEGGAGLKLRFPTGRVEVVSIETVEHGVQEGRVKPWDLVSNDGQEFHPASEHPELERLFVSGDFTPVIGRRCVNHRGNNPAGTCRKCGRSYCDECFATLSQIQPRRCPACNGAVEDPDPRLTERAPWERWREILRYPIDGDAWKTTAALGALMWFSSLTLFLLPLSFAALAFLVHIAATSARGEKKLAVTPNLDIGKLFELVLPVALFTAVVTAIVVGIEFYAPPSVRAILQLPITIASFAYLPMAVGLLLLGQRTAKAFDPSSVVNAIKMLREDYLLIVLLLVAIAVVIVALQTVFSFIPFLGRVLGAGSAAYGAIAQAHALGSFLYLNRERILNAVR